MTEINKQVSQEPTGKDTEEPTTLDTSINNNNIADQLVDKHDTEAQDKNNKEDQLVEKAKHKIKKIQQKQHDIPRILHTPIIPSQ